MTDILQPLRTPAWKWSKGTEERWFSGPTNNSLVSATTARWEDISGTRISHWKIAWGNALTAQHETLCVDYCCLSSLLLGFTMLHMKSEQTVVMWKCLLRTVKISGLFTLQCTNSVQISSVDMETNICGYEASLCWGSYRACASKRQRQNRKRVREDSGHLCPINLRDQWCMLSEKALYSPLRISLLDPQKSAALDGRL